MFPHTMHVESIAVFVKIKGKYIKDRVMFIGVDIGGSNMAAGLFDENRKLITTAKVKSKAKEATDVVIGQLFKVVDKLKVEISADKNFKA